VSEDHGVRPDAHMLVNGEVRLRCGVCAIRPMPLDWSFVQWCDPCLSAHRASGLTIPEFVAARRADPDFGDPTSTGAS
jgi:hypothetical protein